MINKNNKNPDPKTHKNNDMIKLSTKNQEKALLPSEHLFLDSEAERESAR